MKYERLPEQDYTICHLHQGKCRQLQRKIPDSSPSCRKADGALSMAHMAQIRIVCCGIPTLFHSQYLEPVPC